MNDMAVADLLGVNRGYYFAIKVGRLRPKTPMAVRIELATLGAVKCHDWLTKPERASLSEVCDRIASIKTTRGELKAIRKRLGLAA
jgi:hypothetical protein